MSIELMLILIIYCIRLHFSGGAAYFDVQLLLNVLGLLDSSMDTTTLLLSSPFQAI